MLEMLIDELNDETLLRAYQVSYAALQNLSFEEFKRKAVNSVPFLQSTAQPTAEETLSKVEHFIDDYEWEVV